MIYVVDRHNREAFASQLDDMHRLRHVIYVDRRGWKALARPGGREIDQFDTDDTIYLLGLDAEGAVISGVRLNPTTKPHLINTFFSHTVIFEPIPISDSTYEVTRYFVVPERVPRRGRDLAEGELITALLEYGLSIGLTDMSVLCDTFFLEPIKEMRWKVRLLGPPAPYDEGVCISLRFEVSREVIASTRETRGVKGPVYVYRAYPPAPLLIAHNGRATA
jgi:acyl-homoserine lactone synthase